MTQAGHRQPVSPGDFFGDGILGLVIMTILPGSWHNPWRCTSVHVQGCTGTNREPFAYEGFLIHSVPCHAMLCFAIQCYAMLCHTMPCCTVMVCHVMPCHAMLCHVMLRYAMLGHDTLCCTLPCCVMQFYVMRCHMVPCCARILCHVLVVTTPKQRGVTGILAAGPRAPLVQQWPQPMHGHRPRRG